MENHPHPKKQIGRVNSVTRNVGSRGRRPRTQEPHGGSRAPQTDPRASAAQHHGTRARFPVADNTDEVLRQLTRMRLAHLEKNIEEETRRIRALEQNAPTVGVEDIRAEGAQTKRDIERTDEVLYQLTRMRLANLDKNIEEERRKIRALEQNPPKVEVEDIRAEGAQAKRDEEAKVKLDEEAKAKLDEQARIAELDLGMHRRDFILVGGDGNLEDIGHGGLHRMNRSDNKQSQRPHHEEHQTKKSRYADRLAQRSREDAMNRAAVYMRNQQYARPWNPDEIVVGSTRYAVLGDGKPLLDYDIDPRPKIAAAKGNEIKLDKTSAGVAEHEENPDWNRAEALTSAINQDTPLIGSDVYTSYDDETSVAIRDQSHTELRSSAWANTELIGDPSMMPKDSMEKFFVDLFREMMDDKTVDDNPLRNIMREVASHAYQNEGQIQEGLTRGIRRFLEKAATSGNGHLVTDALDRLLDDYDRNKAAKEKTALHERNSAAEHHRAGESRITAVFRRAAEGRRKLEDRNTARTSIHNTVDSASAVPQAAGQNDVEQVSKRDGDESRGAHDTPHLSHSREMVDNSRRVNPPTGQPAHVVGFAMASNESTPGPEAEQRLVLKEDNSLVASKWADPNFEMHSHPAW